MYLNQNHYTKSGRATMGLAGKREFCRLTEEKSGGNGSGSRSRIIKKRLICLRILNVVW